MATIRQRPERGEGVWEVSVSSGRRDPLTGKYPRVSRTIKAGPPTAKGEPPRKVKELVGILEAKVRARTPSGNQTTLGFVLEEYVNRCRRLDRKRKTITDYESMRERICDENGYGMGIHKVPIGRLGVAELNAFDARLAAAGLSITRRAHYFDFVSQALNMAVEYEWLDRNPVKKMKANDSVPTIEIGHVEAPAVADVQMLIRRAVEDGKRDLATLIFVAAATGARRGELAGITIGAVDFGRGQITIRQVVEDTKAAPGQQRVTVRKGTKTDTVRVVSFGDDTAAVLMDQYARAKGRCDLVGVQLTAERYLWSSEADHSKPWRPDQITHAFTALRDKCGLKHVHLHSLRHLAVTRALEAGVDVKTASGRFGHDPSLMLKRYAHAIPASDRVAAEAGEKGLSLGR